MEFLRVLADEIQKSGLVKYSCVVGGVNRDSCHKGKSCPSQLSFFQTQFHVIPDKAKDLLLWISENKYAKDDQEARIMLKKMASNSLILCNVEVVDTVEDESFFFFDVNIHSHLFLSSILPLPIINPSLC